MENSDGRQGGNQGGRTEKHGSDQAKRGGMAETLSGARDGDEAEDHTSGKD